jgi:hypothetical protein
VSATDITMLLVDWSNGNEAALEKLTPLVYQELHLRARNYLRHERADHTLQPTALTRLTCDLFAMRLRNGTAASTFLPLRHA